MDSNFTSLVDKSENELPKILAEKLAEIKNIEDPIIKSIDIDKSYNKGVINVVIIGRLGTSKLDGDLLLSGSKKLDGLANV